MILMKCLMVFFQSEYEKYPLKNIEADAYFHIYEIYNND